MILQVIPPPPPPPPNGWPGNAPFNAGPCNGIECIPIDQGALVIIVVGLIIGIYYLTKERNKNRKQW
jgi:hypothetical protein